MTDQFSREAISAWCSSNTPSKIKIHKPCNSGYWYWYCPVHKYAFGYSKSWKKILNKAELHYAYKHLDSE